MVIEFWDKHDQTDVLFGLTRLPIHQFYLAYRNPVILQHLKKNKLPIIGTDWWEPVYSSDNEKLIGQVQVLTALGTEDQIKNLELERGFRDDVVKAKFPSSSKIKTNPKIKESSSYFTDRTKVFNRKPVFLKDKSVNPLSTSVKHSPRPYKVDIGIQSDMDSIMDAKDTTQKWPQPQEMLSSFLKLLEQKQKPVFMENSTNTDPISSTSSGQISQNLELDGPKLRRTSDLLDSLQKALSLDDNPVKKVDKSPFVKVQVSVIGANHLPSRKKVKGKCKQVKGKNLKQEANIMPSTYVTFETMPGEPLQITNVCAKSITPQWNHKCVVNLPMDLLTNGQKRLIFKVWKKSTNVVLQPNIRTDLVLGFAAVDLSVLLAGLPCVQGWFNIIDFSGKCNGQINIHVNPLENIDKLRKGNKNVAEPFNCKQSLPVSLSESEECNEVLSRALKRKFTELDEITERLRLRLSEVVREDSEESNDETADEFENDINNLCLEEDFNLINFEEEARKFNINYNTQKMSNRDKKLAGSLSGGSKVSFDKQSGASCQKYTHSGFRESEGGNDKLQSSDSEVLDKHIGSNSSNSASLDKHIFEGKQRIDTLLEKLSLINSEANQHFTSRYVSGCSMTNEAVDMPDTSSATARNHSQTSFPHLPTDSVDILLQNDTDMIFNSNSSSNENSDSLKSGSETSVITNFSDYRPTPDGQGTNREQN